MVIAAGSELLNPNYLLQDVLQIGAGSSVADFGCGATAINTLTAAKLVGEKGQVYAVDILKTVLSSVASHATHEGLINIKTIWADLEKPGSTKLAADSLDFVTLVNILFQIKDPAALLTEARRLLKSGGQVLVVDWQARDEGVGPAKERRIPEDTMRSLIETANLKIVKALTAGPHHYGFVASK